MKIHRFIGDYDLKSGPFELTEPAVVRQIAKVLRLKPGEELILCDGRDLEARGKIVSVGPQSVQLTLWTPRPTDIRPQTQVALYCSILKKENFDLVVQKATELGVMDVVPVITRRTVKQNLNLPRLRAIAHEAAELSGRGTVPEVHAPLA